MIDTKEKLRECLETEENLYRNIGYKGKMHAALTRCEVGRIFEYVVSLRKDEYYSNKEKKYIWDNIKAVYYRRKHNVIGIELGMSIPINTFGKGLLIYHSQGIIVHRNSRSGEYCRLHGLNCIGNNGSEGLSGYPQIGNCLDLGVGAKIIGDVELGNNIKVGSNAVVCKSYPEDDITLIGVPAKPIKGN